MIKLIVFSLIFLMSNQAIGQLAWSDSFHLKWSDFKGLPAWSSDLGALSTTSIECDYFFSDSYLQYTVTAVFYQDESWVIDSSKYLLEHESMHFAITEIYARKIRKYLSKVTDKKDEVIRNTISSLISKMNGYQTLYDEQTNHSLEITQQKKWAILIRKQLQSLNLFAKNKELICL